MYWALEKCEGSHLIGGSREIRHATRESLTIQILFFLSGKLSFRGLGTFLTEKCIGAFKTQGLGAFLTEKCIEPFKT